MGHSTCSQYFGLANNSAINNDAIVTTQAGTSTGKILKFWGWLGPGMLLSHFDCYVQIALH
jgi:hypothetical protein